MRKRATGSWHKHHRLMLPADLMKCRSRLTPGEEVQLDVERRVFPCG